jgi:antitoxin component of MazEF toxin-antitoxin module
MKDLYIVQPYKVGKSLGMIMPADLAKEYKIGISTILALSPDDTKQKITIQTIARVSDRFEKMIPAGESFEASTQRVSSSEIQ